MNEQVLVQHLYPINFRHLFVGSARAFIRRSKAALLGITISYTLFMHHSQTASQPSCQKIRSPVVQSQLANEPKMSQLLRKPVC